MENSPQQIPKKMSRRHWLKMFLLGSGLALTSLTTACQGSETPRPMPIESSSSGPNSGPSSGPNSGPNPKSGLSSPSSINALGTIRPAQKLDLSFTPNGPIKTVKVELGSRVKANDVLAELDTTELALALREAQANVVSQQAALDQLITDNAQQITQAEINLQTRALQLEQARLEGPDSAVAIAQTNLNQLDLQIEQSRAQSSLPDIAAAEAELRRTEVLYGQAKEDYERVLKQHWRTQEELDPYGLALTQAEADLKKAQAALAAAQNSQQAHGLGVDVLDTEKEKAEVELNQQLNNQQSYRVNLAILATEVEAAQLELDNLQAQHADYQDQTDETVTQAEARLRQAQLAVKRLEQQLQDATLHAPFNGIISAVYLHRGEWAQAGAPVVEIIDTGRWRVETKNVSELDIARIRIGQEALVRVMAFQNEVVKGKVLTISPVAVVQQGDTTYTLMIELEDTQLNLLPGMNVEVEILTDEL